MFAKGPRWNKYFFIISFVISETLDNLTKNLREQNQLFRQNAQKYEFLTIFQIISLLFAL